MKLNDDMISLGSEINPVTGLDDPEAFGDLVMKRDYQENIEKLKTNFEEGPWVFKRNGIYYMVYAAGGVPEHMAYSTASDINGPWRYQGRIMDEPENSFTIHGGCIEFKGRNFFFYHNGVLPNGGGFRRSTCVEEFEWTSDGKIPLMPFTKEGVKTPIHNLNPFNRVEAETIAYSQGVKTDHNSGQEHYVTSIHNGDYIKVRSVDFGDKGASKFLANLRNVVNGASIEVRIDSIDGALIGTLQCDSNSGKDWHTYATKIERTRGVHDLYMVFRGGDGELFEFDWWQMK